MKKTLPLLTMLLLGACATQDRWGSNLPPWKVLGVGNTACATYLQQTRSDPGARHAFTQWVLGYITALNAQAPNIQEVYGAADLNAKDLIDPMDKEPMDWLDDYCIQHPTAPFHVAARQLIDKEFWDMRQRRLKEQRKDLRERLERQRGLD
jgi:hypothetical protein